MGVFDLLLTARTEHVKTISLAEDTEWQLSINCTSCHEKFPKVITFSRSQQVEMEKQHGEANFTIKCKNCDKKAYILIQKESPYRVDADQNGNVKGVIAKMECRGVEITKVGMKQFFMVEVEDGTHYDNADFTDLWCEYNDKNDTLAKVEDARIDCVKG